jgi:hypothetical protein
MESRTAGGGTDSVSASVEAAVWVFFKAVDFFKAGSSSSWAVREADAAPSPRLRMARANEEDEVLPK